MFIINSEFIRYEEVEKKGGERCRGIFGKSVIEFSLVFIVPASGFEGCIILFVINLVFSFSYLGMFVRLI